MDTVWQMNRRNFFSKLIAAPVALAGAVKAIKVAPVKFPHLIGRVDAAYSYGAIPVTTMGQVWSDQTFNYLVMQDGINPPTFIRCQNS